MIGIIGALEEEVNLIKNELTDKKDLFISGSIYTVGKLFNKEVVITKCGVGKVFSAIAAEGNACAIALAMAAQLQVDRLMLRNCRLFDRKAARSAPVYLRHIIYFARRNLALVASGIQFTDTDEAEIRHITKMSSRYARIEVCAESRGEDGLLNTFFRY